MRDVLVLSEFEAYQLLYGRYGKGGDTNQTTGDVHEAANKIIALAEQIKAERAVAAMQQEVTG